MRLIRRAIDPEPRPKPASTPARSKRRIRADIVWQQLVRGRYQSRLQLSDKEVVSALAAKKPDERDTVGYDYPLRPILFLVPPGRRRDRLRGPQARSRGAAQAASRAATESIPSVRAMRDVAVRDQVIRTSADLPESLRKVLDSMPVGELTAPEVTRHGIEMFAVCSKKRDQDRHAGPPQGAREPASAERFEQESKKYLRLLRKNAMIERGK